MRVRGPGLRSHGVLDGDLLVIDRSIHPQPGHLVVVAHRGEFLLRSLLRTEDDRWLLPPLRPGRTLSRWRSTTSTTRRSLAWRCMAFTQWDRRRRGVGEGAGDVPRRCSSPRPGAVSVLQALPHPPQAGAGRRCRRKQQAGRPGAAGVAGRRGGLQMGGDRPLPITGVAAELPQLVKSLAEVLLGTGLQDQRGGLGRLGRLEKQAIAATGLQRGPGRRPGHQATWGGRWRWIFRAKKATRGVLQADTADGGGGGQRGPGQQHESQGWRGVRWEPGMKQANCSRRFASHPAGRDGGIAEPAAHPVDQLTTAGMSREVANRHHQPKGRHQPQRQR
ncbi:MAG: LexA family protein [Cyanobacteriota bacterium]